MITGYLQFQPVFGDVAGNRRRVLDALADVSADLIVVPELPFSGYHFADRAEAMGLAEDPRESETVDALTALCRARGLHLVTGFTERAGDRLYNSALLIGPDGLVDTYRKLHLFNTETRIFDAGDTPLPVHEVAGARIGIMVCFDWAFPEAARTLALRGAQVICHPSNLVLTYCQDAMLTRCVENRLFAVTANRHGPDLRPHGELVFTGQSQVVAPGGRLLHRGPADSDELFLVEIDPREADDKAITPLNDLLGDRRPEFYA
jgi:predicted amidohydrolase